MVTFIMRTARTLTGQIDETSIQEQFCGLYHGQIGGLLGIQPKGETQQLWC
ncbi:MAG: hypothetical protein ACHP8B_10235 [Terriglobales bacterium]